MDQEHRGAPLDVEADIQAADPVGVLVVDDSEIARQTLSAVVHRTDGFTLSGCAGSGEEGLLLLSRLSPDLILLDVHMPGLGGAETARRILELRPAAVVVLVSADAELLREAAELSGVRWSLPKRDVSGPTLASVWAEERTRAAEARRQARALRAEAEALKAQAAHQTQRARRARPKHNSHDP